MSACELFEEGVLSMLEEERPLDPHASVCVACRIVLERYRRLVAALSLLERPPSPSGWKDRLLADIRHGQRAELAAQEQLTLSGRLSPAIRRWQMTASLQSREPDAGAWDDLSDDVRHWFMRFVDDQRRVAPLTEDDRKATRTENERDTSPRLRGDLDDDK